MKYFTSQARLFQITRATELLTLSGAPASRHHGHLIVSVNHRQVMDRAIFIPLILSHWPRLITASQTRGGRSCMSESLLRNAAGPTFHYSSTFFLLYALLLFFWRCADETTCTTCITYNCLFPCWHTFTVSWQDMYISLKNKYPTIFTNLRVNHNNIRCL